MRPFPAGWTSLMRSASTPQATISSPVVCRPATVTLVVNGIQLVQSEPAGEFTLAPQGPVQSVSGYATDVAGNVSPTVQWP